MKRKTSIRQKGALLIEVLLAMTILSVGLVLIIRSLMMSLRSMVYTADYSAATLLAENKMYDILLQGSIESDLTQTGAFEAPYEKFRYELKTQNIPQDNEPGPLNKVTLDVRWTSGRKKHNIAVATFLPEKKE